MADLKLTQVPTLTDFDYMLLVKGDQVAKMEKATFATVVAELIGTAGVKTGLMPSSNGIPYLPSSGQVDDLNTVHEKANKGISAVYAVSNTSNKPIENASTIFIHMQRLGAGVVSNSQVICQFCGYTGNLYYRTGHGNGSGIDWQTWKKVV